MSVTESFTQPFCSKTLIHSGTKKVMSFMRESVIHFTDSLKNTIIVDAQK